MRDMQWLSEQVQGGLPTEEIDGIPCFVLGTKVVPIRSTAPPIPRSDIGELVTVRGEYYHRPGCIHWDTGDHLVSILVALDCGALPCTTMPRMTTIGRAAS